MTGYQSKKKAAQDKLAQPAKEPVDWEQIYWDMVNAMLRDKLRAQPAQEPVAWSVIGNGKFGKYKLGQTFVDYEATHIYWKNRGYELVPVYTTPPQRTWVGLTEKEKKEIYRLSVYVEGAISLTEAKLKELNNG